MKPDFTVRLGDFAFERFEVPELIPFGGEQMLNTHQLPGGGKVVDAMGAIERDIAWSGLFQGERALARAEQLDAMRAAGRALKLTWHEKSYTVVIAACEFDFSRFYLIPYRISCVAVTNDGRPKAAAPVDADTAIKGDMADATSRASVISIASVSDAVASVASAVRTVSNFVTATVDQIEAVAGPLLAARDTVETTIIQIENIANDPLAAIIAGNLEGLADTAASVSNHLDQLDRVSNLYALDATLARMETNIASIGETGAIVTQAGGDLYQLASEAYGDATAWVDIARANGLVDPVLTGVNTITLPANKSDADGVLTLAPGR